MVRWRCSIQAKKKKITKKNVDRITFLDKTENRNRNKRGVCLFVIRSKHSQSISPPHTPTPLPPPPPVQAT